MNFKFLKIYRKTVKYQLRRVLILCYFLHIFTISSYIYIMIYDILHDTTIAEQTLSSIRSAVYE